MESSDPNQTEELHDLTEKLHDPAAEDETETLHAPPTAELRTRVPDHEIEELRDKSFTLAFPGYNRKQVDAHLVRVNRILAELQITAAPESAIRHALAKVSEETSSIIESANKAAEETTGRAKSDADERVARAEQQAQDHQAGAAEEARQARDAAAAEAQQVREAAAQEATEVRESAQRAANEFRDAAEARVRELEADAQAIAGERVRLIEGLRELTRGLDAYLDAAEQRYADVQPAPRSPQEPPEKE